MSAIVVQGLSKFYRALERKGDGILPALKSLFIRQYRTVRAVDDISFSIEAGEMVAFLGPNGAGKTTTLKMLSGLIFPSQGSATVLGYVPWQRPDAFRRQFALVMGQKNQLWWDLPAHESFRLHREIYQIEPTQFNRVKDQLVELLSVEKLVSRPVRELSLGERMKMELIAALLHSPKVLFLDEPTIGLDVVAQNQLRDFLNDYNKRFGVTVILTSHYMKDVETLCERAIIINHGKLVHDGSLSSIQSAFGRQKTVKVQFASEVPTDLRRFGEVVEQRDRVVTLRVERDHIAGTLAHLLDASRVTDISVDEVPLEEVIAEVFQATAENRSEDKNDEARKEAAATP